MNDYYAYVDRKKKRKEKVDEECLLHIGHSGRHFTGGPKKDSDNDKNRKEKELRASVNNYQEMQSRFNGKGRN